MESPQMAERTIDVLPGNAFSCLSIPDGLCSLGDDIFLFASQWKGVISIHVRRFSTHDSIYYPTKEGVTINPIDFSLLMRDGFDLVRNTMEFWVKDEDFEVSGTFRLHVVCYAPFKTVKLSHHTSGREKNITLSQDQWKQLQRMSDTVSTDAVILLFHDIDLMSKYQELIPLSELTNDSDHFSRLRSLFKETLTDTLVCCCELDPSSNNSFGLFNAACYKLNIPTLVSDFFYKLSDHYTSDNRPLNSCVTAHFFDKLNFRKLLDEVRCNMCGLFQF